MGPCGKKVTKTGFCLWHLLVNRAVLLERLSGRELRVTDPGGIVCNPKGRERGARQSGEPTKTVMAQRTEKTHRPDRAAERQVAA